jgi:hypothetical protein
MVGLVKIRLLPERQLRKILLAQVQTHLRLTVVAVVALIIITDLMEGLVVAEVIHKLLSQQQRPVV